MGSRLAPPVDTSLGRFARHNDPYSPFKIG
jgi:hypothetical protein